jgi:signal transduction histidine kinase/DNA-binding response OmpR family regulator
MLRLVQWKYLGGLFIFFTSCLNGLIAQPERIKINQQSKEQIILPYYKNDIDIEYVGIHFQNPRKIQYQYKMEGVHDAWVKAGTERIARFNNLNPGQYKFLVKAANADGVWSETPAALNIQILAPWWWNWLSKTLYTLTLLLGIYSLYQFQLKRSLEKEKTLRLQELDKAKTRMYTNITHEFRTPLSIIQGMTEQLEGNEKLKATIQRNSFNLLNLVNQMLDLSKLETGNLPLKMVHSDIIAYLSYLIESFHSMAISKSIHLHFLPKQSVIYMDYDPDKLMKIMINILSNAIKFTGKGGNVYIIVEQLEKGTKLLGKANSTLSIQVKDTGIGISAEELPHIFDRFFQGNSTKNINGTGIGLAYTRELVKILNGKITVTSEVEKGSVFTVFLPITKEVPMIFPDATKELIKQAKVNHTYTEKIQNTNLANTNAPLVLIVEDNRDVKEYLFLCLKNHYQLEFADHGAEGIQKAIELVPDIILSDVMMPEKDGFELCEILKSDRATSHVPIILLTAKADLDAKVLGIQKGADAYMAKPFNKEELLVRMEQLIQMRKALQKKFSEGLKVDPRQFPKAKYALEIKFLDQVNQIILENLEKESFNPSQLSKAINLSSSQLYRKLKAITGKSTAIYIRHKRLMVAKDLLETTGKTVSEIAYAVGFKELAYFSRCFSEEFGINPSQFRKG